MWSICIHGGAGDIPRTVNVSFDEVGLRNALRRAVAVIKGESRGVLRNISPDAPAALAAAVEAVAEMEDNVHFNAGRGSCLTREGKIELEAAVMVGNTKSSGACTGVTRVRNPVLLAEYVRAKTPHTLIGFGGAEVLAKDAGLKMEEPDWFIEGRRLRQQEHAAAKGVILRDHDTIHAKDTPGGDTVGAVVLDADGVLAGAVSTGGVTNKYACRIGDTPCIGSGLYADSYAAVCGTGFGEDFVATNACAQVCHAMKFGKMSVEDAVNHVLYHELRPNSGGLIAVDAEGHVVMDFTSGGMHRAMTDAQGNEFIGTWK